MEAELKPLSPQPEPKPNPKPDYVSEPILKPDQKLDYVSEPILKPDYDSKPVHHSKPDDASKPPTKPDYESGPETKPDYQSKPLLKPDYGSGPETRPDYGSGPEVKLDYESRPDEDTKPLLKPDYESGTEMKLGYDFGPVTKPEAIAPARPDQDLPAELSIEELEEKFAAYVRRDVYGTMGRGEVPVTEKVLLGFGLVTLVPIRIVLAMTLLVLYYVVCKVCTAAKEANHEEEEQEDYAHLGGWRRGVIVWTGRFLSRAMLFVLGFYWISERECGGFSNGELNNETVPTGQYAEPDSPGAIISNHVSYLDILYHMSSSFPSFVAKRSVARLPLVGLISKCLGCVYVQRESKSSNFKGVSGVIHERICEAHQNADAPRIMLFPEGTTTNGDFLLPFKTGAFLAKAPVRPVILRYPYQRFSPAWDTISGVRHVILLLCQFVNHLEVTRLPVYCPSQQEKDDPKLYAENVRRLMAREGNLTLSDIGLPEKRVYHAALHGNDCMPTVLHPKED